MPSFTIVTPVGPYHADVVQRAIDSVNAQTAPCHHIVIEDTLSRGAGWGRNRGLDQCETEFIAFLDADDTIEPNFAAVCLGILDQYAATHGDPRYIYTDWLGAHNVAHKAPEPCEAWTNKTFHLVTTVIPTAYARAIGGFDEVMQGAEDADFYVRLRLSGVCGLHVNAPLVHYREGGQRSLLARVNGQEAFALDYMTKRYGGYNLMGCCGDNTPGSLLPEGEPLDGDVLVQAQWSGNMVKRGLATGRLYHRTSFPKMLYVSPDDAAASPHLFKRVQSAQQMATGVVLQPQYKAGDSSWQSAVSAAFGGGQPVSQSQPIEYKPNVPGRSKGAVVAKAAEDWSKIEGSDL